MFEVFDKVGEATVERVFLSLLEGFGAEELDAAVESDISLLDETARQRPKTLALAERLAKRFAGQERHLTFDNVMLWLGDRRPDFYFRVRFSPNAQAWMRRQVEETKAFLFG